MSTMRRLTPDLLAASGPAISIGAPVNGPVATAASRGADAEAALRAQQERLFAEARERGHAEGMREADTEISKRYSALEERLRSAHEAALSALQAERSQLHELLQSLQAALASHASDAELLAVEVAYAAVVRLLGEKSVDRSLLPELCRAVVREYGHPPATLRVSEQDFALLQDEAFEIPLESDRRLRPGQCVVDTARGQFESGLDVRLEALTQALLSAVAGHRADA